MESNSFGMDDTDISFLNLGKKKHKEKTDSHSTNSKNQNALNEVDSVAIEVKKPIRSVPTKDEYYNTSNKNLGIALIFNHKEIKGQEPRKGTERDRDRVNVVLKQYGFDVRVFNDLTFADLNDQLKAVAKEDHSNNDCLVVVVMSHGMEGMVFAKDMKYPVERLWTPFLGNSCKSLIDKPKLFFIQACRGRMLEKPVVFMKEVSPMSRFTDEIKPITYAIPNTADLMVFYSTFDGHYSFRNVEKGSWFIQSLCLTLEEAAQNGDEQGVELFRFLTTVNRKVAYEYQSHTQNDETNEMKEMPNFLSTLTKLFYLKVKLN